MRAFALEFGIGFPLWIDPEGRGPEAFGVWGHPSTVLIDRAGRIVGRIRWERDWGTDDARRLVEWLLATGIGRGGRILAKHIGAIGPERLVASPDASLAGSVVSPEEPRQGAYQPIR